MKQSVDHSARFIIDKMACVDSYISIQGNIGAGKSTLFKHIKQYLSDNCMLYSDDKHNGNHWFITVDEPLADWTRKVYTTKKVGESGLPEDAVSIFDIFYRDMERYGFLFQVNAFITRISRIMCEISDIQEQHPGIYIYLISERSLTTDHLFFANLYNTGIISQVEYRIYEAFYNLICGDIVKRENVMVYIPTPPEVCHMRILKRDRPGEDSISLNYLTCLHQAHQRMIRDFRKANPRNFIISMELEGDCDDMYRVAEEVINGIICNAMRQISA